MAITMIPVINTAFNNGPAPVFLKQVKKQHIRSGQGSSYHIRDGSSCGGAQIGTKLFCTHCNKDGPEAGTKTQQSAIAAYMLVSELLNPLQNNKPGRSMVSM